MIRKVTALTLVCVMLLALLPAFAASKCPKCGKKTYTCVDDVSGSCTEGGFEYWECSSCGYYKEKQTSPLGHKWGKYDYTKKPTCTTGGYGWRVCERCGIRDGGDLDPLGHSFNWTITPATCTEDGSKTGVCGRCGHTWTGVLEATGHQWSDWKVVTEATQNQLGCRERHCEVCGLTEYEYISLNGSYMYINKAVTNYDGATPFSVGEVIEYEITVSNHSEDYIYDVEVTDPLRGSNEDAVALLEPVFAPGETLTASFSYTVRDKDAGYGYVTNTATVYWAELTSTKGWNNELEYAEYSADSNTVTVPVAGGSGEIPFEGDPLTVTKRLKTSLPEDEWVFSPDDKLVYVININNNTAENIVVRDVRDCMTDWDCALLVDNSENLVIPGEELSYVFDITPSDCISGLTDGPLTDFIKVEWSYEDGHDDGIASSNEVTVTIKTDEEPEGTVEVYKILENAEDGSEWIFGLDDELQFQALIVNNTDRDITITEINDYVSDYSFVMGVFTGSDVLPAHSTTGYTFTLTLGEIDPEIQDGAVTDYLRVSWIDADSSVNATYSDDLSVTLITAADDEDAFPGFTKSLVSSPANGLFFTEDETVKLAVEVTNSTERDITVTAIDDHLLEMGTETNVYGSFTVAAGESYTAGFDYTVTWADANLGHVTDYALVSWHYDDEPENEHYLYTNDVAIDCGIETAGLTVTKSVVNADPENTAFLVGNTANFTVTVTNTADEAFTGVHVYDVLTDTASVSYITTIDSIAPGETCSVEFDYVIQPEDVERGEVTDYILLCCDDNAQEFTSNSITLICEGTTGRLNVMKMVSNSPENGSFFCEGEVINYTFYVYNYTDNYLANAVLTDDYIGESMTLGTIAPFDSCVADFYYTVTYDDCEKGSVYNAGYVTGNMSGMSMIIYSTAATAPTGFEPEPSSISCEVKKQVISYTADSWYRPGEKVIYLVTMTNTGNVPITDITAVDVMQLDAGAYEMYDSSAETLEPGCSVSFTFEYTLTLEDCLMGKIYDNAYVTYSAGDVGSLTGYSNECWICTTTDIPQDTDSLVLVKYEISTPALDYYVEGETVSFMVVLYNGTGTTYTDVSIYDILSSEPGSLIATASTVYPSNYILVPVDYVVQADDIDILGYVSNIAWASAYHLRQNEWITVTSNEVIVPCGRPTPEKKHPGASSCVKTLVASNNGSELIRTDLCGVHHAIELAALSMDDPAEIAAMWERDVVKMYSALVTVTGSDAFAADRELFLADVHMLRELLGESNLDPVIDMLRERSTELCYELSGLARRDNLLKPETDNPLPASTSNTCSAEVLENTGAWYQTTYVTAGGHLMTQNAADRFIAALNADASKTAAVLDRVNALWNNALSGEYVALVRNNPAWTNDLALFTPALEARKASLSVIYPDDPDLVNGLIIREIKNRVIALCENAHD